MRGETPLHLNVAHGGSKPILYIHSAFRPGLPRAAPDPPHGRAHGCQWSECGGVTSRINVAKPSQGRARPFLLHSNARSVRHFTNHEGPLRPGGRLA
jgi:hypothetical protein